MLQKWKSLRQDQKQSTYMISGVIATGLFIYFGFGTAHGKITACFATVETFQRSYFEDDYTYACTDLDGEDDICEGTNYWDKAASEVYRVSTINGNVSSCSGL